MRFNRFVTSRKQIDAFMMRSPASLETHKYPSRVALSNPTGYPIKVTGPCSCPLCQYIKGEA